jgi:hypothetical protein
VFFAALTIHISSLPKSRGSLPRKKRMRHKDLKEILISSAIAPVVQKYRPTADELYKLLLQIECGISDASKWKVAGLAVL